jgi:hypothetical protein
MLNLNYFNHSISLIILLGSYIIHKINILHLFNLHFFHPNINFLLKLIRINIIYFLLILLIKVNF